MSARDLLLPIRAYEAFRARAQRHERFWASRHAMLQEIRRLLSQLTGADVPERFRPVLFEVFASEYHWTVEVMSKLDDVQALQLLRAAVRRRGIGETEGELPKGRGGRPEDPNLLKRDMQAAKGRMAHTPAVVSAADFAKMLGMPDANRAALESFLRRYRKKYPDCYVTTEEEARRRNEPKYLYRVGDVLPALKEHFEK
jgi:hypothetical protein